MLAGALQQLIKPLKYCDTSRRGYMVVTATADACRADWIYVNTITSRDFTASSDAAMKVMASAPGCWSRPDRRLPRPLSGLLESGPGLIHLALVMQPGAWSLTRPMACISAYMVVGPTNFQPRFLSSLDRAWDSAVCAGTASPVDGAAGW